MMTYTYRCNDCEHTFETKQRITEDSLTDCPKCEKENTLKRVIQLAGGFRIFGRGVYKPTSSLRS